MGLGPKVSDFVFIFCKGRIWIYGVGSVLESGFQSRSWDLNLGVLCGICMVPTCGIPLTKMNGVNDWCWLQAIQKVEGQSEKIFSLRSKVGIDL